MVETIINFVLGKALPYICSALLLVCISLGIVSFIQYEQLETAHANIKTLKAEKAALGDKIAEQNRKVDEWVAKAKDQEEKIRKAQTKAERVRTITVDRVREITVAAIPTACPDAIKWSAEHAIEFNKRWEAGE